MQYDDTCKLYDVSADRYGNDVLGTPLTLKCKYVQITGYSHSNSQDAVTSDGKLFFPPTVNLDNYRLEGKIVEIHPFGGEQYYKIVAVTPARDVLQSNSVMQVECDLAKVSYVS